MMYKGILSKLSAAKELLKEVGLMEAGGGGGHGTPTPSHSLRQPKYVFFGGRRNPGTFAVWHTVAGGKTRAW